MGVVRKVGRILHFILRYTLPPAIPLACAGVAALGIALKVHDQSARFREARADYWEYRRRTGEENPELREALRAELDAYIQGPAYLPDQTRQRASYYLFELLREEMDADPAPLRETVQAILEPEPIYGSSTFAEAAVALADRGGLDAEAKALVSRGLAVARERVDERQEDGRFEDEEAFQKALAQGQAPLLDARGWIYLNEGQLEEAELDLSRALETTPNDGLVLYHMGRLFEAKLADCLDGADGENPGVLRADAEDYFLRGTLVDWWPDWKNPNIAALEAIYRDEHGSLDGFDAHFAEAIESYERERRERVLARCLEEPKELIPFELEDLAGGTVSSASLAGKVAVINFWGTWCGPCVKELPELQLLHEKYRDDPDIVVLTVSARDESQEQVREWMAERHYTYPVLWDGGHHDLTDLRGYPTTWFIDRQGAIQFDKLGTTIRLLDEFSWMVEELRAGGASPSADQDSPVG